MELIAKTRTKQGKKLNTLRRAGILPAVMFGKNKPSVLIQLNLKDFQKVFKDSGESSLIDLNIENKKSKVLVSEVQHHPTKDVAIHVNFHEVDLKEKITAEVPIEIVGEAPAVKNGLGIIITLIDEIEVECLPTNLPKVIEVDVSTLTEVDQGITIGELNYNKETIKITHNPEDLVLKIAYAAQLETEEEKGPATLEDIEVTGEKPKEEGEGADEGKKEKAKPSSKEGK